MTQRRITVAEESKYASVSLPKTIAHQVDHLIDRLGYWPSRAAFVREACLEKIGKHKAELKQRGGGK